MLFFYLIKKTPQDTNSSNTKNPNKTKIHKQLKQSQINENNKPAKILTPNKQNFQHNTFTQNSEAVAGFANCLVTFPE